MKAAVIRKRNEQKIIEIEDAKKPYISNYEALIKVKSVGICGSDVQGFNDQNSNKRVPGLIMGHEAAGEVVKIGDKVTKVQPGDRVAIDPQVTCGNCYACKRGWYSVCDNKKIIGSNLKGFLHGTMAEYASINQKQLFVLPDHVEYQEGAVVEPVSNALHIFNRVKTDIGNQIVVLGAGTLGLCILQVAKLSGARNVIVTDVSEERLKLAEKLGANITVNSSISEPVEEIKKVTKNRGADIVVEAVGISQTYKQAIDISRKKGNVMFFGAAQDTIDLNLYPILHKELNLIGCTGAEWETQTAVDYIANGKIDVKSLITDQFSLDSTQEAFNLINNKNNQSIKVILKP